MKSDMTLVCKDCGQEFVWTVGEQGFYEEKGLPRPEYCMICRGKYGAERKDKDRRISN